MVISSYGFEMIHRHADLCWDGVYMERGDGEDSVVLLCQTRRGKFLVGVESVYPEGVLEYVEEEDSDQDFIDFNSSFHCEVWDANQVLEEFEGCKCRIYPISNLPCTRFGNGNSKFILRGTIPIKKPDSVVEPEGYVWWYTWATASGHPEGKIEYGLHCFYPRNQQKRKAIEIKFSNGLIYPWIHGDYGLTIKLEAFVSQECHSAIA